MIDFDKITLDEGYTTKEIGSKFEESIEKILRTKGYSTARNQRIEGTRGQKREIDIIATSNDQGRKVVMAVECKKHSSSISNRDMVYFYDEITDIGIKNGLFVSWNDLQKGALETADYYGIEVWTRDEVMEYYLSLRKIKRMAGSIIDCAIPLSKGYEWVVATKMVNQRVLRIKESKLAWRPVFKVQYDLKKKATLPNGDSYSLFDNGICYIDGLTGEVVGYVSRSNRPTKLLSGFSTIMKAVKQATMGDIEENDQLKRELELPSISKYSTPASSLYDEVVLDPEINTNQVSGLVIRKIIERNVRKLEYTVNRGKKNECVKIFDCVPKKKDVKIHRVECIHVPRWQIRYQALEREYVKECWGGSGTVTEDTMSSCPNHRMLDLTKILKKGSFAFCEICGDALCSEHVHQCPICGKFLCGTHSIPCPSCKAWFCPEHIPARSQISGKPICIGCLKNCSLCGRNILPEELRTCSKCNKHICPSCVTSSRGLIRKEILCHECSIK